VGKGVENMCLVSHKKVRKTQGFGWKLYEERGGVLYSTECAPYEEQEVPRLVGKWLRARADSPFWGYKPGFHIFKWKKDALLIQKEGETFFHEPSALRKVEYRKARLVGPVSWSFGASIITPTIVADEVRIGKR